MSTSPEPAVASGLAAAVERLRRDMQTLGGRELPPAELRRRVEELADLFLWVHGRPPEGGPEQVTEAGKG